MTLYDRDYVGSSEDAVAVDLSSTDYSANFRRLYVGTAGSVKIDTGKGTATSYEAAVGYLHVQGSKVYKIGTAATDIVAEF